MRAIKKTVPFYVNEGIPDKRLPEDIIFYSTEAKKEEMLEGKTPKKKLYKEIYYKVSRRDKKVAFEDNTVARENLPYPIVHYPGFYGTFFGFQKDENSPIVLCSCSLVAFENYINFRLSKPIPKNADPARIFILDSSDFPMRLIQNLLNRKAPDTKEIIKYIEFGHKLCHECNKRVPKYRYCVEMYGGAFKQNFGWYIKKQAYEWGIVYDQILHDVCPGEILDLWEMKPADVQELAAKYAQNSQHEEANELWKKLNKQQRKIWNIIENEVRMKFGHKKVGEAWSSETILYYIIKSLFPGKKIERHYRAEFLEGLELDIFIPELELGIEYQGIQHFEPIDFWGGEEALERQEQRDKRKKELCDSKGVAVVYFDYDEGLNDDFVLTKLKKHIRIDAISKTNERR